MTARLVCALGFRGGRRVNLAADPDVRAEVAGALADAEADELRERLLREARALPDRVPRKAGGSSTREAAVLFLLDRAQRDPRKLRDALATVRRLVAEAVWLGVPAEHFRLAAQCRRTGATGWGVYRGFAQQIEKGTITLEAAVEEARGSADAWDEYSDRLERARGNAEALDAVLADAKRDGRLLHSHRHRLRQRHAGLLPGPWAEAAALPELPAQGEPDALGFREGALGPDDERAAIQGEGAGT